MPLVSIISTDSVLSFDPDVVFDGTVKKQWYKLKFKGTSPGARVGHTLTYLPEKRHVISIGGSTKENVLDEVWCMDLKELKSWKVETEGFRARYEHQAAPSGDGKIVVFGGAEESTALNDTQVLDLETGIWENFEASGSVPSPRTVHQTAIKCVGTKQSMIVFSGGDVGRLAVGDTDVHELDIENKQWIKWEVTGTPPVPRQGHVTAIINDKLYVHGGLYNNGISDDLHILDENRRWHLVAADRGEEENSSPALAAHSGVVHNGSIYIFGGLSGNVAVNNLWQLNIDSMQWTLLNPDDTNLPSMLDFAMCVVEVDVQVPVEDGDQTEIKVVSKPFIMIHGGIDTTGQDFGEFNIFPLF